MAAVSVLEMLVWRGETYPNDEEYIFHIKQVLGLQVRGLWIAISWRLSY